MEKINIAIRKQSIDKLKSDYARVSFMQEEGYELCRGGERTSLMIGAGKKARISIRRLRTICRQAVRYAKKHKLKKLAVDFKEIHKLYPKISAGDLAELIGHNFELANFDFVKYKTSASTKKTCFVEEIVLVGNLGENIAKRLKDGQFMGEEVNKCRDLVNTPSTDLPPIKLAKKIESTVAGLPIEVEIFDREKIKEQKMGGIIAVAGACEIEPRVVVLKYQGAGNNSRPVALVGKAVTFDAGGMNLKPSPFLLGMHMDMAGGASVIYAIVLAAKLGLPVNAVGVITASENMISPTGYRPADIITTMSGKTVEVLNTDAEGRIIMADGLTYVSRIKPRPKLIVDVATLTGAALVALGQRACAFFTRDEKCQKLFLELGEKTGNYVWPLPMWEEYEEEIMGSFGDITNIQNHGNTRYGGAIIGAVFLYQFVKECGIPWVHMDIAPRIETLQGDFLSKGATGEPVALLVELLRKYSRRRRS